MKYLQVPTRVGESGARDKAAIITSLAQWTAQTNREFLQKVREIVKDEKTAEGQVKVWFDSCCNRTYNREFGDVFAHPSDTMNRGGDCDDLTILLLAGLMSIGIPCCPDVVMRNGNGVHVRVRCGLPPHNPPKDMSKWIVLDPSKESERIWVGGKKSLYNPQTISTSFGVNGNSVDTSTLNDSKTPLLSMLSLLALVIAGFALRAKHVIK